MRESGRKKATSGNRPTPRAKPAPRRAEIDFPAAPDPLPAPPAFFEAAESFGLAFDTGEVEQLGAYLGLLLETNKVVNLTAIRDPEEAWTKHILDSLTLLPVIDQLREARDGAEPLTIIDIGAGGGLPGIPIAICAPDARVTLLDATEKKCRFLRHAVEQLGLPNATVIHDRAERAAHDRGSRVESAGVARREGAMRASFDLAMARAVGRLPTLLELTVPFVRTGGLCALIKGEQAEAELEDASFALSELRSVHAGSIQTPTGTIVVIEKTAPIARTYPRADGLAKSKPLVAPSSR